MKRLGSILEHTLPWFVLGVLLLYTYAKFFEHPYMGFRLNPDGEVMYIFVEQKSQPTLELTDQVISIGSLRWTDFRADLRQPLFEGARPGDEILLTVQRAEQTLTIPWELPEPNPGEINDLLVNEGWLAYIFWWCGTIALVSLRPKDDNWRLLIAFNYLTALWLTVGSGVSMYHIWGSALLLRMSVWFCVPVYLRLHWIFPRELARMPVFVRAGGYVLAGILAVLELFQLLPTNLYLAGFLIAVLGSLILIVAHFIFQPDTRKDLRILLIVALLSFVPAIALGFIATFIAVPGLSGIGLVGLTFLPIAYLYGIGRRNLGGVELRLNRIISIYLFIFLLGVILVPLVTLAVIRESFSESLILTFVGLGTLTTLGTILWFPAFQAWVERRILGIRLPARELVEGYVTHITTCSSILDLTTFLETRVLPSLFVRQFVFLQFDNGHARTWLAVHVTNDQIPTTEAAFALATAGEYYIPAPDSEGLYPWVRLALPLRIENKLIGLWLFGRRDPDDIYSQVELPILQLLANQTAIALSNILHSQQLRDMYEENILRHEQERLRLARDLHDSVLNELAALAISDDAPVLSPKVQETYDGVTQRLREIVSDLRPPMLNFGLRLGLEGLADNLMERSHDTVQVVAHIQTEADFRYPESVEINLFRIAQEACQNALRYAHAKTIQVMGTLTATTIEVSVVDDGIGFVTETSLQLDEMTANKHFGLLNMLERANLIGAEIKIDSKPGQGTQVRVKWGTR